MRINHIVLIALSFISILMLSDNSLFDMSLLYFGVLLALMQLNDLKGKLIRIPIRREKSVKTLTATHMQFSDQSPISGAVAPDNKPSQFHSRIYFNESLNKAMAHAKRHKKYLAVLHITLDAFAD